MSKRFMRRRSFWALAIMTLFWNLLSSCTPTIVNGYTDAISYRAADSLSLFIQASEKVSNHPLKLYDIQQQEVASFTTDLFPQDTNASAPWANGFGYEKTVRIQLPELPSGVYQFENKIPFVVRPNKACDVLIVYTSNTENAYCSSGGKSLYAYNSTDRDPAFTVSFQRPTSLPKHSTAFLRWIDTAKDLNVGYISDQDLEYYDRIRGTKLLVIAGHSEYWTRQARLNFDRFITEGNNALILSGNTMYWQVRYSKDGSQMHCFRMAQNDPISDPLLKTIRWTSPKLDYPLLPSIGLDFSLGGLGKNKTTNWAGYQLLNSASPLLQIDGIEMPEVLRFTEIDEYDGAPLHLGPNGQTIGLRLDSGFFRYELIGYELLDSTTLANGAWVVMQRSSQSGVVINTGNTDWCSKNGMAGENAVLIKQITLHLIDLLLQGDPDNLFTPSKRETEIDQTESNP